MLSHSVIGLALCLIVTHANTEAQKIKPHQWTFYHDAKMNSLNKELFKEALKTAGLDPTGIELGALREKIVKDTTYTKAFFVNKSGYDCQLNYSVAIYQGVRFMKLTCMNND